MASITFPTSVDIYLEVNGKKVAVVQNYRTKTTKHTKPVEAFGSAEPVGHARGKLQHIVELTRVYATDDAIRDKLNFHTLENFSLVIVKPTERIVYTGCEWNSIGETGTLNETVAENVQISASGRRVD